MLGLVNDQMHIYCVFLSIQQGCIIGLLCFICCVLLCVCLCACVYVCVCVCRGVGLPTAGCFPGPIFSLKAGDNAALLGKGVRG